MAAIVIACVTSGVHSRLPCRNSPADLWAVPTCIRSTAARPVASVNFITAHDGFTMNDLVSYNEKHNEANGEGNRDGESNNRSWNCGVEGPTTIKDVNELRQQQMRNMFATLLLSQSGIPDDLRRRRSGAHPAGQRQRLLPGQCDLLDELGFGRGSEGPARIRIEADSFEA